MRKAIAAAGVAAAITTVGSIVYINADGGGDVVKYTQEYDRIYAAKQRIVVNGGCYSSCTMVLGYPNSCLGPNAVLGFHPAYTQNLWAFGLFSYTISKEGTVVMRRYYPSDALAVIDKHHGLDDNGGWWRPAIRTIPAKEFPSRYHCANT